VDIRQGEVYYVKLPEAEDLPENWGSGPAGPHPVVVISHDSRNVSRINTVVVCIVSDNLHLGEVGGNVVISEDEAGLRTESVANVSQILTLDKRFLGTHLGRVHLVTMHNILKGVRGMLEGYKIPY
jgi:mRNA interferase MazF